MKQELLINIGKMIMGCYAQLLLNMDLVELGEYPEGAKLFASNHPTTTDPFFLGLLTKEPMRILVTANAFEVPVFREYLYHSGHIPVERRKGKNKATIARAVTYLNEGKNVGIFPEGSLSPEIAGGFGVLPARSGAARIALQAQKPIIPVGIAIEKHGIYTKYYKFSDREATGRWMIRGAYVVTVGNPIFTHGDPQKRSDVQAISEQITAQIRRMTEISQARLRQQHAKRTSFFPSKSLHHR